MAPCAGNSRPFKLFITLSGAWQSGAKITAEFHLCHCDIVAPRPNQRLDIGMQQEQRVEDRVGILEGTCQFDSWISQINPWLSRFSTDFCYIVEFVNEYLIFSFIRSNFLFFCCIYIIEHFFLRHGLSGLFLTSRTQSRTNLAFAAILLGGWWVPSVLISFQTQSSWPQDL